MGDVTKWEDRMPLLEVAVHCGDLSNVCRPQPIALKWTDAVLAEFFAQGDRERLEGYELSPLCNRKAVSKPNSQIGFINFIVEPLLVAVASVCDLKEPMENMQDYIDYWRSDLNHQKNLDLKKAARN